MLPGLGQNFPTPRERPLPAMAAGMTGAPVRMERTPNPRWKVPISPERVRVPSGNKTRTSPFCRTVSDREIAFLSPSPRTMGNPPRFRRNVLKSDEEVKRVMTKICSLSPTGRAIRIPGGQGGRETVSRTPVERIQQGKKVGAAQWQVKHRWMPSCIIGYIIETLLEEREPVETTPSGGEKGRDGNMV